MDELQQLEAAAGRLIAQLLSMFTPHDCATLLRHMADEIEVGQSIADRLVIRLSRH